MTDPLTVITMKYIKVCEGSVRVKIERGEEVHLRHFKIRHYPSLSQTLEAAVQWRDETHMKHYGIPVLERIVQIAPRQKNLIALDPTTGEKLPELSTGLSYGFHRDRLLYVVASYQVENRPKRKRFSISKLGIEGAIKSAMDFRFAEVNKDG